MTMADQDTVGISVGDTGKVINLPGHWEELDSLPDDIPGTVAFGYRSTGSYAVVTLGPLDGQMMPVDRDEVVDAIQPALAEAEVEAVLVEVDAGETPGGDLAVYTIVKTEPSAEEAEEVEDPDGVDVSGVQFNLTLNLAVENGDFLQPFLVQGYFTSTGDDEQALGQAQDIAGRVITA